MSFEPQETRYTCGLASLRYALSLHGIGLRKGKQIHERDLRTVFRKAGLALFREGVDESEIARAARRLGLDARLRHYRTENADRVIEDLKKATSRGHSCIVTWHDDDENHFHWVCVAGFAAGGEKVIVLDPSYLDEDMSEGTYSPLDRKLDHVPALMSLSRFRNWITPEVDPEKGEDAHFFLELWPDPEEEHRFVPGLLNEELFAEMRRDPELYVHFDEYIDDLRDIFGVPSEVERGDEAWRFLEQRKEELVAIASRWTLADSVPRAYFVREIDSLVALTRCYAFRLASGADEKALGNLCFYLGWRACEHAWKVGRYER